MDKQAPSLWRYYFAVIVLLLCAGCLVWRMMDLNIFQRQFLMQQSNARILRVVNIPAYRGMITDRFHQPLAISAQVDSIWVNPQLFDPEGAQLMALASILKITPAKIRAKLDDNGDKEFIYLKRGVPPAATEAIRELTIPGIFSQHEYHRFYPQSDVTAHVIGFTNIDDQGQEGLELQYDTWLKGIPGKKKVLKDRLGNTIADLGTLRPPRQGHDLVLSLDTRLQYLASESLREGIEQFSAKSGSIVVLDVITGEVLAMVNYPTFNPNMLGKQKKECYRNRAMTDLYEPGSTIKTFSIISALESGLYRCDSRVNTSPGWMTINGHVIHDEHDNGSLSLAQILQKSSDVGVAKITLSLPPERLWALLDRMGFAQRTDCVFPGEASGTLLYRRKWQPFELATLSFGYGISVTAIQVAHAYAAIASLGIQKPMSLLKVEQPPVGTRVMKPEIAASILVMLETVVKEGTGSLAKVPRYRVAGKTGTVYQAAKGGYDKQHYISSFVGIAPVSHPRIVIAVVMRDPQGKLHQGGEVAAPVFSHVMSGTLRLLNIPPDDLENGG